eukprot:4815157-Amphidinium_carterae.1
MRAWKTHVDKVAPIFMQAYNEWLDGRLPDAAARSIMVCLPKTQLPAPDETRPLCLINTWLKTLVRLLICRLEDNMAGEIHKNQFGFLRGRSTKQCFLELIRCMVELGLLHKSSFTVFWDFSAAFPAINRDWIWRVLERTGCDLRCIRALQLYYRGDSAFVQLHGRKGRLFRITRGVRQGCPGSGLLWAIPLDPVVRAFTSRLCRRSMSIAALWYADDLSTVLRHPEDLDEVDALFQLVLLALSLRIKASKLCVFVHHCESVSVIRETLGHELGIGADARAAEKLLHTVTDRATTFKHLATGIPMGLIFVKTLLLSPCWYRWSVGIGTSAIELILPVIRKTILRGPPKWLPDECMYTASEQLQWPMNLPNLWWHTQVLQVKTALRDWNLVQAGLSAMRIAQASSGPLEVLLHSSPHQTLWDATQWATRLGMLRMSSNNDALVRSWDDKKGFTPWIRHLQRRGCAYLPML